MSFVRAKEIPPHSGNFYDYEVMNYWDKGHVRQIVIQYIGKSGTVKNPVLLGNRGIVTRYTPDSPVPVNSPDLKKTHNEPIPTCKYCHSDKVVKYGLQKAIQYYRCKECRHKFAGNNALPKMKLPAKQIASCIGMYYRGMPLDGLQGQYKDDYGIELSESTFWNWITRFTKEAIKQSKNFKPKVGDIWCADETYMKLGKRNVYFWDIIDLKSNYLLASHVSFNRGMKDASELMKLAEEHAGKKPKVIVTDKLKSYIEGVESVFGADSKHRQGGPFELKSSGDSTAEIERFHKTLEQRTEVFQKYINLKYIKLLTDGWLVYYNFMKQNEGIGDIPPAQAMSDTIPFKDWNDIVRDSTAKIGTDYEVTLHPRPETQKQREKGIKPKVDVTLKPIMEKN